MATRTTTELDIELAKWKAKSEEIKRDIASMKSAARSADLGGGIASSLKDQLSGPLAAAVSIGAIKGLLGHFDDLADTATKLGETPEVLQRVARAAELSGTSVDGLAAGFLKLEKNLGDAENSKAADILAKYGITAEALINMPLDQKLLAIADAFQRARQDGTGVYELQELMGKSSADLIPLLSSTGDELRGMFAGVSVVGDEAVYQLAALNDQLDNVLGNLKNIGGQALLKAHDGVMYFGAALAYVFGDHEAFAKVDDILVKRIVDAGKKASDLRGNRTERAKATQANIKEAAAAKEATSDAAEMKKLDDRWARIDKLTAQLREGEINMLPPPDKLAALHRDLTDVMNAAAAESDIEKKLALQVEAQKLQRDITSTEQALERDKPAAEKQVASMRAPGAAVDLMNLLTGRSSTDLIAEKQVGELREMKATLAVIADNTKPKSSPFHGDTDDTFR